MRSLSALLMLAAVIGGGGCATTLDQICARDLSELERDLAGARSQLETTGRSPAAASEQPFELWKAWAEDQLMRTQASIDVTEREPSLGEARKELNALANELVGFYGFTVAEDPSKMRISLERIRTRQEKVRGLACSGR